MKQQKRVFLIRIQYSPSHGETIAVRADRLMIECDGEGMRWLVAYPSHTAETGAHFLMGYVAWHRVAPWWRVWA
jgi:hypothetical protein